jgi:hypothetical protein
MPPADSTASPGSEQPRDAREQAAAAAITGMVDKFTALTKDWLDQSADAFKTSFNSALTPGYTADQLTKDVAGMFARNLEFLGSLVQVAVPPDDSTSGSRPPGGSRPPSEQTPPGSEGQSG